MTDDRIRELQKISNECWTILKDGLAAGDRRDSDAYWEELLEQSNALIGKYENSLYGGYARKYMLLVLTEIEADWKRSRGKG